MRLCTVFVLACVSAVTVTAQSTRTLGRIDRLDPGLDQFLAEDAVIEVLAGGFTWTEGPVWVADGGYLLFSDIPRNSIFRWSPGEGIDLFMRPSGYTGVTYYGREPGTNGLAIDAQGRLTMCEHGDRRVSVLTKAGGKMTLVDRYQGQRLNSPNDLVFDEDGSIFFTDPPYGLPNGAADERRELDFCGVYRLDPDGSLTLLTKEVDRPNGIGLSPDRKTLHIAQSDLVNPIWMSFPVREDKSLGPGKVIFNAREYVNKFAGAPDGLTVSSSGVIFGSGPGGVYVITPEGKLLGHIVTGGRTSNCTFDTDESYLYITADSNLCRVKMKK